MFTKIDTQINSQYRKGTVGYEDATNDFYITAGMPYVFIRTELQFKIFNNVNFEAMVAYLNLRPINQSPTDVVFDASLYEGTVQQKQLITVCSPVPFNTCFGQYLSTASNIAKVDLDTMHISTEAKTYSISIINEEVLIRYDSPGTHYCFPYFHNAMLVSCLNTDAESLLYPFLFYRYITTHFKNTGRDSEFPYRVGGSLSLNVPERINIPQPKLLFSPDMGVTWFKYNIPTSEFLQVTPSSTYFTPAELKTNGNTIAEYEQIPQSKFKTKFGSNSSNMKVLSYGYILPKVVRHNFWIDKLDVQQYLRQIIHTNKKTLISGVL